MPLIGSIVPIRNKLAYPAGIAPGFDQNHPASKGCIFSYGGITAFNILTGQNGTKLIGPLSNINGYIGPNIMPVGVAGNAGGFSWPILVPASSSVTMAGIIWGRNISSSANQVLVSGVGNQNFFISLSTNVVAIRMGGSNFSTAVTLTSNVPYFLAFSSVASKANFVILNLATGSLLTVTNLATGAATGGTTVYLGNNAAGNAGFNGFIASAMYSTAALTYADLLAWAANPWAFWYPQRPPLWKGTVAAAPSAFMAAWAMNKNRIDRIVA